MTNAVVLQEAIGDIRDSYLAEAEAALLRKHRSPIRRLAAACLVLILFALPVGAEVKNGYISNLLAPVYGGAQTQIVDSIGVPLDASVTVGDYTLKAEAVIGDRYSVSVVYALNHVDGKTLDPWTRFQMWEPSGARGNGGYLSHKLSDDGKTLYLIEQWTGNESLFLWKRDMQVVFTDLVISDPELEEDQLLQEGVWSLRFTARYEDTTQTVWRGKQAVTDGNGGVFTIRKIELSPLGLHMDLKFPARYFDALDEGHEAFRVELLLKDGSIIPIEDYGMGGGGKTNGESWDYNYRTIFDTPIPREDLQAILICGTEFPIE